MAQDDAMPWPGHWNRFCAVHAGSNDPAKTWQIIKFSRDVAVILFLSKNRTETVGGLLRDLFFKNRTDHKGAAYVPELNSLVAFHVLRDYEITPVFRDDPGPILSVFDWYLQEGDLYDLKRQDSEVESADAAAEEIKNKRERAKTARRKERAKAKKRECVLSIGTRFSNLYTSKEEKVKHSFLRTLASEREKCRTLNKDFSRAHVIRKQCLKAGYRFNVGGKLVKVSSAASEQCADDNTVICPLPCNFRLICHPRDHRSLDFTTPI